MKSAEESRSSMFDGLSKREFFAAVAMQGLIAGDVKQTFGTEQTAVCAVEHADKLLWALSIIGDPKNQEETDR